MLYVQFLASTFFLILSAGIAFGFGNSDVSTFFFIAALVVSTYASWKSISRTKSLSTPAMGQAGTWQTYLIGIVIGLTFLGFAMKAAPLQPATGDEISHALNAVGNPYYDYDTTNIVFSAALHHQPPLHYVASSASLRLWGIGETGARFPSIIFACLTLVALFVMCRENGISTAIAMLATFFCGTSDLFFRYALDGRPYTAALFTFTIFLAASLRLLRTNHSENLHREVYATIGAGILFVMSIGMQPAFMMVAFALLSPIYAVFRWKNALWFITANAATAAVTAPVLALIASRAVMFTPRREAEIFANRAARLPEKILADNRWFWNDVFYSNIGWQLAAIILLFTTAAGFCSFYRKHKFANSKLDGSSFTLAGLVLTAAVFFIATTSVFGLFIEHPFGTRHAIINLIIFSFALALSTEVIVQSLNFNKSIRWITTLTVAFTIIIASKNNFRIFKTRLTPGTTNFDARSLHSFLKELPSTMPANWKATGYALDLVDFGFVDYSDFFGRPFYSKTDFPTEISINQEPRRNLPVSRYIIGDIRMGRAPDEFLFLSISPYFAQINALSIAEVPWNQTDGVTIAKFPGFLLTRVEVKTKPLETAIRFFEKIHSYYSNNLTQEKASALGLLLDTLIRLHLESRNCDRAKELLKQVKPESNVILQNEFPQLLATCRKK